MACSKLVSSVQQILENTLKANLIGPESASAHPGPACYRKGGPLTVTDANLLLGRLRPEFFPKIFGPNEDQSLDIEVTQKLFEEMTQQINKDTEVKLSMEEVAAG